jgi:hypothetical protein
VTADKGVEFHKVVAGVLDDFEALEEGPRLPESALGGWADVVRDHADREEIAVQLIALARRFLSERASLAAVQCAALAATVLGQRRTADELVRAGIDGGDAKRMVQAPPSGSTSPLAGGLAPPRGPGKPKP